MSYEQWYGDGGEMLSRTISTVIAEKIIDLINENVLVCFHQDNEEIINSRSRMLNDEKQQMIDIIMDYSKRVERLNYLVGKEEGIKGVNDE